jgi:hypothetical protein
MTFRQLFEPLSSTYTYLLGCEDNGAALLIDPVVNSIDRDLPEPLHACCQRMSQRMTDSPQG